MSKRKTDTNSGKKGVYLLPPVLKQQFIRMPAWFSKLAPTHKCVLPNFTSANVEKFGSQILTFLWSSSLGRCQQAITITAKQRCRETTRVAFPSLSSCVALV